jgi:hypothetical protein
MRVPICKLAPLGFKYIYAKVEMAQEQSQVWWSFPGGIGWPVGIPLKGGKRKTRKGRKGSKKTRKGRKMTRRR